MKGRPHPGHLPEERESQLQSLDNLAAIIAVTALVVIAPKAGHKMSAFVSPKRGRRFTLSSGERAGVRADVKSNLHFRPRWMFTRRHPLNISKKPNLSLVTP